MCFSGEFTENNHKVAQHKESTGREDKDERTIALPDIQAEDGAATQHLAHHTDKCQRQRKAQARTKAIESRLQRVVFRSESLCPTQDDAVYDNQRDKYSSSQRVPLT